MHTCKLLEKYSIGVGDRFAHQAKAQLRAFQLIAQDGVDVVPVWNKSNREHSFVGSEPSRACSRPHKWRWRRSAGRTAGMWMPTISGFETVDRFIPHSDFFTLDVADSIGQPAAPEAVKAFVDRHPDLIGTITIPQIASPFETSRAEIERIAAKFLLAVQDAGKFTATLRRRRARRTSSPRCQWTKPTRRRRRPNCS